MRILAKSYQRAGNHQAAEATVKDITAHFNGLQLKQHVKNRITDQTADILAPDK